LASDSFTSAANRFGSRCLADVEAEAGGETVRQARGGQVRLGLVEVELVGLRDWIGAARRLAAVPARAKQRRAASEQRSLEHVVIGQRIGDGAAHVELVERRDGVVHRDEGQRVVLRRRDHLQLAFGFQRLGVAGLQVDDDVGVALFDQVGAGCRFRHRLDDQALEEGLLGAGAALPVFIALEDDLFAGLKVSMM